MTSVCVGHTLKTRYFTQMVMLKLWCDTAVSQQITIVCRYASSLSSLEHDELTPRITADYAQCQNAKSMQVAIEFRLLQRSDNKARGQKSFLVHWSAYLAEKQVYYIFYTNLCTDLMPSESWCRRTMNQEEESKRDVQGSSLVSSSVLHLIVVGTHDSFVVLMPRGCPNQSRELIQGTLPRPFDQTISPTRH